MLLVGATSTEGVTGAGVMMLTGALVLGGKTETGAFD